MEGFPEEAIVDATLHNPLEAAHLLTIFAKRGSAPFRRQLLNDIIRSQDISSQIIEKLLISFIEIGLVKYFDGENLILSISSDEALRHAAVLRGVAYANFRSRDANSVEITLSPPASPSRLMEELPKQGFSWAKLNDTKDSLIELASQATKRFVIVSPFLDAEGIDWISNLFDAGARHSSERVLIVRGKEQRAIDILQSSRERFSQSNVKVYTYAISHERELRRLEIETFHAKILLADHDKAYVGSANMTRSSKDFSMECGTIIKGPCVKPIATLVDTIIKISDRWL
ncbi:MAG: phospholipase D-like domain-containing protein [Alphaproteobacteria bacterium]